MHIFQGKGDLCGVELGSILGKSAELAKMEKEFSTSAIIKDKEELICCLESHSEANNIWVPSISKHTSLRLSVLYLVLADNEVFLQYLEGV